MSHPFLALKGTLFPLVSQSSFYMNFSFLLIVLLFPTHPTLIIHDEVLHYAISSILSEHPTLKHSSIFFPDMMTKFHQKKVKLQLLEFISVDR